jgi:hypothetical protein
MSTEFNGVTATVKFVEERETTQDGQNWDHNVWKVTLRTDGRQFTTSYMTGLGYTGGELSASDVLETLISDAWTAENADGFEDWANELGYDEDSRSAERAYRTVVRQTKRLRTFLGDRYGEFLALES